MQSGTTGLMGRRILVTGGTGFIGAVFAARLTAAQAIVFTLARRAAAVSQPGVQALRADVLDDAALAAAFGQARPEIVVHLAGSVGPPADPPARRAALALDVLGTEAVLGAARAAGVRSAVVLGSAAQYGPPPDGRALREDDPCRPAGLYGISKAAAGQLALDFGRRFAMPVTLAIPFNVIGPGQPDHLVPATFIRQILALPSDGGRIAVGDLSAERDWIDVRDVAAALALLAARGGDGAFNICTGRAVPVGALIDTLRRLGPRRFDWLSDPARLQPGQPSKVRGDPAKLAAETGWRAAIALEDSLATMLQAAGGHPSHTERRSA